VTGEGDTIRIGATGTHTATYIAGISGVTVAHTANPVVVDSVNGQLGTVPLASLKGADGVGFVTGAILTLRSGFAPPAGFTKIGTWSESIRSLNGKSTFTLAMNVYQKN
jgi:hypothetical protein